MDELKKFTNPEDHNLQMFITSDERYVIKEVTATEVNKFKANRFNYYNHVRAGKTFFVKIFGLYGHKSDGGSEYFIMILENVLPVDKTRLMYSLDGLGGHVSNFQVITFDLRIPPDQTTL